MEFQVSNIKAISSFYLKTLPRLGIELAEEVSYNAFNRIANEHGQSYKFILFIGSNPSQASPDNKPFHIGTRSRQTINSWFDTADFNYIIKFANIVNYKKHGNKPLTKKEINESLPSIKRRFGLHYSGSSIIAVGKDAQYGLELADIEHFKMPHPSGLNRFWNDKQAAEAKIQEMLKYISKYNNHNG